MVATPLKGMPDCPQYACTPESDSCCLLNVVLIDTTEGIVPRFAAFIFKKSF